MSQNDSSKPGHDAEPEYDFSNGERGKYAQRYRAGTNLVKIESDLLNDYPTEAAVNEALRRLRRLEQDRRAG